MTSLPGPRPGRIPERNPPLLSKAERARRKAAGPAHRITPKLIADVSNAVRTGTPLNLVADFAGVSRQTLGAWLHRAADAERKKWNQRTQYDRSCIALAEGVRQAQGEAAMRITGAIANAAGMTTTKLKTTKTVVRQTGDQVTTTTEERELPADWRAAAHLGRVRFPVEMGALEVSELETPAGQAMTPSQVYDRLQEIRRQRAERGMDEDLIDVEPAEITAARPTSEADEE